MLAILNKKHTEDCHYATTLQSDQKTGWMRRGIEEEMTYPRIDNRICSSMYKYRKLGLLIRPSDL